MQCLTPLAIGLRMTRSAVCCLRERSRLDEVVPFNGGIAGRRHFVEAEAEVVTLADFVGVLFAVGGLLRVLLRLSRRCRQPNKEDRYQDSRRYANALSLQIHEHLPCRGVSQILRSTIYDTSGLKPSLWLHEESALTR